MRKIMLATVAILIANAVGTVHAEDASKSSRATCGERWAAHKTEHGKPAKGEGMNAWSKFQTENCADLWKGKKKPASAPTATPTAFERNV